MISILCLPAKFEAKIVRVPFSTCWYWVGAIGSSGYGHMKVANSRRTVGAHRAAYEAAVGPIPEGLDIDHLCSVRTCVNPAHLEPVTRMENLRRAGIIDAINATAASKRANPNCTKGHVLSSDNLYTYPNGARLCRTCKRAYDRQYQRQKK